MAEPKAHRTQHKRKPDRQERVVLESAPSAEIKELLRIVKETDSRSRVLFSKIHNLQVEVAQMTMAHLDLIRQFKELLLANEPTQRESENIVKDYIRQILDNKK